MSKYKYTENVFPNSAAFVAKAKAPAKVVGASVDRSSDSWAGGSMENALRMVDTGWNGRPSLGDKAKGMTLTGTAPAHSTRHSVSGAVVDMGEYLAGMPECMIDFVEEPAPRIVKLGVNLVASGGNEPSTFERRGAVVLALVESLTAAGFGVEVTVYMLTRAVNTDWIHLDAFTLKRADQYLDMDALAFWTCHASAFRRVWFAASERQDDDYRNAFGVFRGGGYGRPTSIRSCPEAAETLELDIEVDTVPHSWDAALEYFQKLIEPFAEK